MKLTVKAAAILMSILVGGCDKGDNQDKAADARPLNAQLKALEQAKQVEQDLQNAAELQRQKIEQETQ